MELAYVALISVFSFAVLLLLARLMGKRQMSQMSMFDYINGITIGSIAAEMATSLEADFLKPLVAMVVYAGLVMLISLMTTKSIFLRRLLIGKAQVLYENGRLYNKNLLRSHLDVNEFLTQCRMAGYFDISQLQSVILEESGKMSFLPVSKYRPATPQDMGLSPQQETPLANVIIDGHILPGNLHFTGYNETWLINRLKQQKTKPEEVLLATCDKSGTLMIYRYQEEKMKRDMFC